MIEVESDGPGDQFQFKMISLQRLAVRIYPDGNRRGDCHFFCADHPERRILQMSGIFHGKDQAGHFYFSYAVDEIDFHPSVIEKAGRGYLVAAAVIPAVGGHDRCKMPRNLLFSPFDSEISLFSIGQEMIEDTGIETHGTGNKPVMDEALVIGNIGIDPETDSVDTIAVVDPDEVDFMDPVFQRLQAGAAEIISRAARDKGQEVICACDFRMASTGSSADPLTSTI